MRLHLLRNRCFCVESALRNDQIPFFFVTIVWTVDRFIVIVHRGPCTMDLWTCFVIVNLHWIESWVVGGLYMCGTSCFDFILKDIKLKQN